MSHRAEPYVHEFTPVEQAIADMNQNVLRQAIADCFERHGVQRQMTLTQLKRLLVLRFHEKRLADWCRDLGVPPDTVEGHVDHDHGGEA